MSISERREAPLLFLGDIFFLSLALLTSIIVRYAEFPNTYYLTLHFVPFSALFLASVLVFFIAGLYEKHTLPFKSTLTVTVFYAQIANVILAAAIFFLVPFFIIQPKVFLLIYLVFSTLYVSVWRIYLYPIVSKRHPEPALLIGGTLEIREIYEEINGNTRYSIHFNHFHDTRDSLSGAVIDSLLKSHPASVIVLPPELMKKLAHTSEWNRLVHSGVEFVDAARLYEELFDRVPLTLVDERILFKKAAVGTQLYSVLKRAFDSVLSTVALVVLSPLFLIVAFIQKMSGGSAVIFQERIGKKNKRIRIVKFRTMLFDDAGDPEKQKLNHVTKFGAFLRRTAIDELPQFWNVFVGDLSLIGPRPEIPSLVSEYEKKIPFYAARHLIQPGMSGWAQVKHASPPKWKLDVEATQRKLSYDLYYLKHRSLRLDFVVALRTVKILLSRGG